MATVYIVQGTTGEDSDKLDWFYKAYLNREKAIEVSKGLNEKLFQLGIHALSPYTNSANYVDAHAERKQKEREMLNTDPAFNLNYLGAEYLLLSCELEMDGGE